MASSQHTATPLVFRIFFFYCEPLFALSGAYLAFFRPSMIFSTLFPAHLDSSITPVHLFLFANLASLWAFFGVAQAVVLRLTSDPKIWSALLGSMMIADVGTLYANQIVMPGWDIYWRPDKWRSEDWGNIGFTSLSLLMRTAYLAWAWQKRRASGKVEDKKERAD